MFIYTKSITFFLLICFLLFACSPTSSSNESIWAETLAKCKIEKIDEGIFDLYISYEISESRAHDKNGKKIRGPITQCIQLEKEPLPGQKLRIRYMREEPIIFELIDPIKYK